MKPHINTHTDTKHTVFLSWIILQNQQLLICYSIISYLFLLSDYPYTLQFFLLGCFSYAFLGYLQDTYKINGFWKLKLYLCVVFFFQSLSFLVILLQCCLMDQNVYFNLGKVINLFSRVYTFYVYKRNGSIFNIIFSYFSYKCLKIYFPYSRLSSKKKKRKAFYIWCKEELFPTQ